MQRKTLINTLLIGALGLLLALALFFSIRQQMSKTAPASPDSPEQTTADLSISQFHHTAKKDGRTEWILDAAAARYFKNNSQVRLKQVKLKYFPRSEQPETRLTADKGRLYLDSNDMDISGHVVVENRKWRMETETLHYAHESNIISTQTSVQITGESLQLRADAMRLNIKTGKLICRGNVEGTLSGIETDDKPTP